MSSGVLKWQIAFETILNYSNSDGYWSFHFWGVTLPTGDRFHSIPICVFVNIHATAQKMVPLTSIGLPYWSWKSGEWFLWLRFALICWMLWFLRLLSIFLVKGNIMKVWQDCSWLQILVNFLVERPENTKDEQWNLICILLLPPRTFVPHYLSQPGQASGFWYHDVCIWGSALPLCTRAVIQPLFALVSSGANWDNNVQLQGV